MDERTERLKEFARWYAGRLHPGDTVEVIEFKLKSGIEFKVPVGRERKADETLKAMLLPHVPEHDKPATVGKVIAAAAGVPYGSRIRMALSSLRKDGKIVSDKGGYRKRKGV